MESAATSRASSTRPRRALRLPIRSASLCGALAVAAVFSFAPPAAADESGVSFWIPGLFGSLAAVPQQAGWSEASIYYHTSVSADGSISLAREFQIGNIPVNASAHASANVNGTGDAGLFIPSYVFATPVFGGQAAASLLAIYGNASAALAGTVAARSAACRSVRGSTASAARRPASAISIRCSRCAGTAGSTTTWPTWRRCAGRRL